MEIKMKKIILTLTAILTFFTFQQFQAQDRWGFEFRPSIDLATQDLGNADLERGVGFEGSFSFRFMPHLAAYAGWSWNNFGVDQSFAGSDASFEETGYTFGLQFIHPIGQSDISYLLRSGATYNHIEIENNDGDIIIDSGHGLGWQIEAGLSIQLSGKFSLLPSIRYRALSRDIEVEEIPTTVELNYLSVGVGLNWSF
jgi:hypothetical protein